MTSVTVAATGRRARVARPAARAILANVVCGALGFGCAGVLAVSVPAALGMTSFAVLSGSMAPTLRTGDVVVARPTRAADARVGDVITFSAPGRDGTLLTHRVVGMRVLDDSIAFVTRGDANTGVERWTIPRDGSFARVAYRIPKLGYVTNRLGSRVGRILFIALPALLLALLELRRIWSREGEELDHAPRA